MKIEFRKVPLQNSEFEISLDSAQLSGTFSKISSKLAKIEAKIDGNLDVDCCKCGSTFPITLNEEINLLISDGIFSEDDEVEEIVIEIDEHIIDFEEIFQSELESLKSEYYVCDSCKNADKSVEIEY
jgi:hypothetical protein